MKMLRVLLFIAALIMLSSSRPPLQKMTYASMFVAQTEFDGPDIKDVEFEDTLEFFEFLPEKQLILHTDSDGTTSYWSVVEDKDEAWKENHGMINVYVYYMLDRDTREKAIILLEYFPYNLGLNSIHSIREGKHTKWLMVNEKRDEFYKLYFVEE